MKEALKFVVCSIATVTWLVLSFFLLFILAPALVSATSTISVITGFAIVLVTVIINLAAGIFLVKQHLFNKKETS